MRNKEIKIIVVTHKAYKMPEDTMYFPVAVGGYRSNDNFYQLDSQGENISEKNFQYSELTALYWAWKNLESDYIGLVHYRRHMALKRCHSLNQVLTTEQALKCLQQKDVLVVKRRWYPETIKMHYINCHKKKQAIQAKQIDILKGSIEDISPEYIPEFEHVMGSHTAHMYNMFVMSRADLNQYCEWLFSILFETEKRIEKANVLQSRLMGALSEFLLDTWLQYNRKSICELYLYQTEMDFGKRMRRFIQRRFLEK